MWIGVNIVMEAHHGKVLQSVEFRMTTLLTKFEEEHDGENSNANYEDGDQASKQRIQWRRRRHYVWVWMGVNTNSMECDACKRKYTTITPGLCFHIPSSPTSSSDGPFWFSFPIREDSVLMSVKAEAVTGWMKGAVGIVSEVVDWEQFWCSSLRLVDEGIVDPGVMAVLFSGMRDGVISKEPNGQMEAKKRAELEQGLRRLAYCLL